MTITVYIGDVTDYLGDTARIADKNATLITNDNYLSILPSGTYYTSCGDLTIVNLFQVLHQANNIIYSPPAEWSSTALKESTEQILAKIQNVKHITGFNLEAIYNSNILGLADIRKTTNPQLWVAGCSVSHGIGVNLNERYGLLISEELNMPVSFLTHSGSSIEWAADQILRSNIKTGDTIVWGLTSHERMPFFSNNRLEHLTASKYLLNKDINKTVDISLLISDNRIYHFLTSVFQVINFCKKLNVKLVIVNLMNREADWYLLSNPSYINLKLTNFYDVGTDDQHPGPVTHQFYAKEILKKIRELI